MCEVCTQAGCLRCAQGFALNGSSCLSCLSFDPRCVECSSQGCSQCADAVLRSARRSGFRAIDSIPFDDVDREFSISLPFGSQSADAFAEAETYELLVGLPPLRDRAVSCAQGLLLNASWSCAPTAVSHVVCGHAGVFSFTYPNYVVKESAGYLRLAVRRTGGGAFPSSVRYSLTHISSTPSDASATAPYTSSLVLVFDAGVIEKSFLVTVFDNPSARADRVFEIALEQPIAGSLGPQSRVNVTIVDDNSTLGASLVDSLISLPLSQTGTNSTNSTAAMFPAGSTFSALVTLTVPAQGGGGGFANPPSVLALVSPDASTEDFASLAFTQTNPLAVAEIGPGTFNVTGNLYQQGNYSLFAWYAQRGGLLGSYFSDAFLQDLLYQRIDRAVDFSWDAGTDALSVRWVGGLSANSSGTYFFAVATDDSARLSVAGVLILDHFASRGAGREGPRAVYLEGGVLYSLSLEFRRSASAAYVSLLWGVSAENLEPIPSEQLYTLTSISNSPLQLQIIPATPSASRTECFGEGLFSGVAGEAAYFSCCPRDAFGNPAVDSCCSDFQEVLAAVAAVSSSPNLFSGAPETVTASSAFDASTGCFDGYYTPLMAGEYTLNISLQAGPFGALLGVAGSPFAPVVAPSRTSYFYSLVANIPSFISLTTESCLTFTIVAKDIWNNLRLQGGDLWTVRRLILFMRV